MTIFEYIHLARRRQGLSQSDLAAKVGVSRNYIGLIEMGRAAGLMLGVLSKVVVALGFVLEINFHEKDKSKNDLP